MTTLARILFALLTTVAAARTALFLHYAWLELPAPPTPRALEGPNVHFAWRAMTGRSVYPDWRNGDQPANWMGPLYFRVVGGLGRAAGADIDGLYRIGRSTTFVSVLLTSVALAFALAPRRGVAAAILGGLVSLGGAPLVQFGVMTRPDAFAQLLGFSGLLLASKSSSWGAGVLVAAAGLTKQTTLVFAAAAILSTWWDRGARPAAALAATVVATFVVGMGALGGWEPHAWQDLFQHAVVPSTAAQFRQQLEHAWTEMPELLLLAAVAVPAVVQRRRASATLGKLGSNLNYFLDYRLLAGVAAAAIAASVLNRPRPTGLFALLVLTLVVGWGGERAWRVDAAAAERAAYRSSEGGRRLLESMRSIAAAAADPTNRWLTDSPELAARQNDRAPFLDPYLYRICIERGLAPATGVAERLKRREYSLLLLGTNVGDPTAAADPWALPPQILELVRIHYRPVGFAAQWLAYEPLPDD